MVLTLCQKCSNWFENYKNTPTGGYVCRECIKARPKIWTNMAPGFVDYDPAFMKYRLHQITRSGILSDTIKFIVDKNGKILSTYNKSHRGKRARYNSEIIAYISRDGRRIIELVYYNTVDGAKRFHSLTGMTHEEYLRWKQT